VATADVRIFERAVAPGLTPYDRYIIARAALS